MLDLAVAPLRQRLQQVEEVEVLLRRQKKRRKKRKRKKVRNIGCFHWQSVDLLTPSPSEKEESDEDMGFGLFD